MTDLLLPPNLIPNEVEWGVVDGTGIGQSPTVLTTRTATSYGNRLLACRLMYREVTDRSRAQLMAIIQRGRADRYWLTDVSTPLAGSMSAPELIANNTFANGTTGWTASAGVISATDRYLRVKHNASGAAGATSASVSVTQYAPYVGRTFFVRGFSANADGSASFNGFFDDGGSNASLSAVVSGGMALGSFVPLTTSARALPQDGSSLAMAGDYFEVPYVSLARGAQADNGGNLLQRSDEFDNVYWTKTFGSVTATTLVAPDGSSTAETFSEDGTTNAHALSHSGITIGSGVAEYAFSCAIKVGNRSWCYLDLVEATGSTLLLAYFNLAGSGTVGTISAGANWSNVRAYIHPLGNSWYRCSVVGRKTNAATSLQAVIGAASADNTASYAGSSFASIGAWRATLTASSVPTRLIQTTSAAVVSATQQGSAIYTKGLPASTNGLLKIGDLVGINGELKRTTTSLDSDADGLGYLQFEPQMRTPTPDNAPVIFQRPMGKFMLASDRIDWPSRPGRNRKARSDFTLEFVEAP